jgi:hypothetical protein
VDARGSGTVEATPDDELVERATLAEEVENVMRRLAESDNQKPNKQRGKPL